MPSSAYLVGGEETRGVKARVRRLVELSIDRPEYCCVSSAPLFRLAPWLLLISIVVMGITIERRPEVLASVHALVEHVVAWLS